MRAHRGQGARLVRQQQQQRQRARARCVSSDRDSTTRRDAGVLPWSEVRAKSRVCGKERDRARAACWYASASETASRRKHKRQETKNSRWAKSAAAAATSAAAANFTKVCKKRHRATGQKFVDFVAQCMRRFAYAPDDDSAQFRL